MIGRVILNRDEIPFSKPWVGQEEINNLVKVIESRKLAGGGEFMKCCEAWIEQRYGVQKALLTTSCTSALEMSAMLCGIQPGDEVILPSFTFPSTANAFLLRGAIPRFVDIRIDTLNIDETAIEAAISPRTKAIVPVHYAGVICEMDAINDLARDHDIAVIEDAAQAQESLYKGKPAGTLSDLSAFSFHETKNFVAGEGGALLINRPELIEKAEIIREKGTNRSLFIRGEIDKYGWVDAGSSYIPSELISAVLFSQLEKIEEIKRHRRWVYKQYTDRLKSLSKAGFFELPYIPDYIVSNCHIFFLICKNEALRDRLLRKLKSNGIQASFHYTPLHSSPMSVKSGFYQGALPVTEFVSSAILRLPLFPQLSENSIEFICGLVEEVCNHCEK